MGEDALLLCRERRRQLRPACVQVFLLLVRLKIDNAQPATDVGSLNEQNSRPQIEWQKGLLSARLSLRGGGGQRKLQRERAARRQDRLEGTWDKLGISRDRAPKWERKSRREPPPETESEGVPSKPAWKRAEFRLRAKGDTPWEKWGKKWREETMMSQDETDEDGEEPDAEIDEGEGEEDSGVFRRFNDGKGNMNFTTVEHVPENITDVNEYQEWVEDHMMPFNRWVTMEDLLEDQEVTLNRRAGEALFDAADDFLLGLNISDRNRSDGYVEPVVNDKEHLEEEREECVDDLEESVRDVLRLDPNHSTALTMYGLILHTYRNDLDGAEVMFERAVAGAEDSGERGKAQAGYASVLLDSGRDVDKAYALREQAMQALPDDPWVRGVLSDERWSRHVAVKRQRRGKAATKAGDKGGSSGQGSLAALSASPSVGVRSGGRQQRREEDKKDEDTDRQDDDVVRPDSEGLIADWIDVGGVFEDGERVQ